MFWIKTKKNSVVVVFVSTYNVIECFVNKWDEKASGPLFKLFVMADNRVKGCGS